MSFQYVSLPVSGNAYLAHVEFYITYFDEKQNAKSEIWGSAGEYITFAAVYSKINSLLLQYSSYGDIYIYSNVNRNYYWRIPSNSTVSTSYRTSGDYAPIHNLTFSQNTIECNIRTVYSSAIQRTTSITLPTTGNYSHACSFAKTVDSSVLGAYSRSDSNTSVCLIFFENGSPYNTSLSLMYDDERDIYLLSSATSTMSPRNFLISFLINCLVPGEYEKYYDITVDTAAHGSASSTHSSAVEGTVVYVTFDPDSGYSVDWDNVTITTVGSATVLIKDTDTTGHFIMPAGDVTINPAFVRVLRAGVQVSGGNGTATVSNEHPAEGDTVTITCYPDSGYEVDTVTSFDATISQVATNQYQFTMPNVDVLATVTFKETPFFNITVEATSNGTVSANPTSGYSGTTIQLTVAPDTGYNLKHLYVLAGTDSVPTTKVDDTHYTFTLPSFNVVVRALFTDGDPYSPGGNSDPSTPGGTGSFDDNTTPITPPAIPSVSVQDSGLYTIFSLTQSELNSFTNYLWSDLFSLPTVTKYLNNATEHILSLHILPFTVATDSSREIKFMGIGTSVNGHVVSRQHQQIDCGSVLLEEYYGSALDYNPWTKIKLYVPYCGEIELDPDEVMGKSVSLKYTIDILTGDCYANIAVSGTTMYQLSGNCAMRLPVSASNWSSVLRAAASGLAIAAGVGATAMGAVGAGLTAAGASTIGSAYAGGGTAMDVSTMDAGLALQRAGQAVTERTPQVGSTNSYMATMSQKSSFVHTGVQTGGASFMSVQVPYILIKRPRQALPENYNHYVGYPAHYTRTLGNMSGFTQIVDWNPSSIPCTENERTEIDRLLKEGVIL